MEHSVVYKVWLPFFPPPSFKSFSMLIVDKFFSENKETDRVLSVRHRPSTRVCTQPKIAPFLLDNAESSLLPSYHPSKINLS